MEDMKNIKDMKDMDVDTIINTSNIKKPKIGAIYKIINTKTNKVYIGSSKNVYVRFYQHVKSLLRNKHHSIHLQYSWNKYGSDSFIFKIIERIDIKNFKNEKEYTTYLREREQYYIDSLQACNSKYGYNINKKAQGGRNSYTFEDLHNGKCPFTEGQFFYIMEQIQNPYIGITELAKELKINSYIIYNLTNNIYPLLTQDYYIPKRKFHKESELDEELKRISGQFQEEI